MRRRASAAPHGRRMWNGCAFRRGSRTARISPARLSAVLTRISVRTAHRVITISHSARDDIVRSFGLAGDKVDVAPLGVRLPKSQPARAETEPPTVLCVAQKRPYKNLGSLIRAV